MNLETVRRFLRRRAWLSALPPALLVFLFLSVTLAWAEEWHGTYTGPVSGTRVAFAREGRPRSAWAGTLGFQLDSGEQLLAFCIQLDVGVGAGNRYRTAGPVEELPNGCKLGYILSHYPGTSAGTPDEAAARQMAIWHFSDGVDLTTITNTQSTVRERAIEIADAAEAGPCPSRRTTKPDLAVEPGESRAPVGRRILYTVSAGALDAGQPITIALTGPAVLDDETQAGTVLLDASGSAVIGVTGTGVGTTTVSVELPYRLEAGMVLSQIDDSRPTQRLVMATQLDLVARAAAAATWDEAPTPTVVRPSDTPVPATASAVAAVATHTGTSTATAVTPTPTATTVTTATATALDRPTNVPASTPTTADRPNMPSSLPRTGGQQSAPWLALGAVLVLVGTGLRARRPARSRGSPGGG